MLTREKARKRARKVTDNVIVLGTEYPEYRLFQSLVNKGKRVHCFITDDPWKYNSRIDGIVCRYPSELMSLCERFEVTNVYYCDKVWLEKIPSLPEINLRCYHNTGP